MKSKPTGIPGKIPAELGKGYPLPVFMNGSRLAGTPRLQLKDILVPIDFSDCSKKALVYAIPYAKEFGAQITLIYVAQFHYAASETDSAEAPILERQHIARANAELLKLARQLPTSLKAKTVVIAGKPFVEIVAATKVLEADLIIIGTHGAWSQHGDFLGSTAERVIRYASCPVLVVREHERDFVTPAEIEKGRRRKNIL